MRPAHVPPLQLRISGSPGRLKLVPTAVALVWLRRHLDKRHNKEKHRQDGDRKQGDGDAEAAGQEERLGAEGALAKPTAVEEVQEEGQASAVSEGRRAQAEPALAVAEAPGEELTVEEAPPALAAAEEPAEGGEMASAANADGGDAGDDGRADPAGEGSTAFDQVAGDTRGFGIPGRNADHAPIRRSIRIQPSPRWLGAGLAPGLPGPLRGWECQTYTPRPHSEGPSRPYPSSAEAEEEGAAELPAEEEVLRLLQVRQEGARKGTRPSSGAHRGAGMGGTGSGSQRAGTNQIRTMAGKAREARVVPEEGIANRPATANNDEEEAYVASEEGELEEVSPEDEPRVANHHGNARSGGSRRGGNWRA
ncbi:unnamed protein product [Closterium sp. NIES-65]|nr:unnamed protein product [Closterium sp. NIES-65]